MKKTKFIHLTILSLMFFSFINTFLSHSFPAYSTDNSTEPINTENSDFHCYEQYPENKYPQAKSYCHALANTKIPEKDKIWENLTAITEDNKKLIWENNKINSRLLVVTWAKRKRYEDIIKKKKIQNKYLKTFGSQLHQN